MLWVSGKDVIQPVLLKHIKYFDIHYFLRENGKWWDERRAGSEWRNSRTEMSKSVVSILFFSCHYMPSASRNHVQWEPRTYLLPLAADISILVEKRKVKGFWESFSTTFSVMIPDREGRRPWVTSTQTCQEWTAWVSSHAKSTPLTCLVADRQEAGWMETLPQKQSVII